MSAAAPPIWPPDRYDRHGHFKKRAIPGPVKVAVVEAAGARPGQTTPANCTYCAAPGRIWWPLTYTGKVGTHVVLFERPVGEA